MKIAVFENEWKQVEAAFKAVNILYYDHNIQFSVFQKSQDFQDLSKLSEYDLVLIDLDLSIKSKMDGFKLIQQIKDISIETPIVILTGSSYVKEKLQNLKLGDIPYIKKPVEIDDIKEKLSKFLK